MFKLLSSVIPSFPKARGLRPALPITAAPPLPPPPAAPRDLDAYAGSPWVYVAVSRIAEAGALVPLHVYRREGERKVTVENHPLELLLERPNPFLSRFELFEQTLGFLELTGSAYWYLSGSSGAPQEIWPLRPDRVSVVPHPERHVAGYIYEVGAMRVPLAAEEVVHFRRWHPTNDYLGLSPVQAARMSIDGDRAMAQWNRAAFSEDRGIPAGIVTINDPITETDFERIKREWRANYGGGQRRTAFLRGGSVQWQAIGLSHTDLDFLNGRRAHRDEILSIFGVPVGLIDANATEANATVAERQFVERQFVERTLWPKLVRVAQKITADVLPFWGAGYLAEFADIRPTDHAARLAEIEAARGVLTTDELRARFYQLGPAGSDV